MKVASGWQCFFFWAEAMSLVFTWCITHPVGKRTRRAVFIGRCHADRSPSFSLGFELRSDWILVSLLVLLSLIGLWWSLKLIKNKATTDCLEPYRIPPVCLFVFCKHYNFKVENQIHLFSISVTPSRKIRDWNGAETFKYTIFVLKDIVSLFPDTSWTKLINQENIHAHKSDRC